MRFFVMIFSLLLSIGCKANRQLSLVVRQVFKGT
jgi:hypothetical protein